MYGLATGLKNLPKKKKQFTEVWSTQDVKDTISSGSCYFALL